MDLGWTLNPVIDDFRGERRGRLRHIQRHREKNLYEDKEWRRQWHPTPVLLPGNSHGQRSLVGCSPWGHEESDTTEGLHFHFSLLCIGEGNGNPLQRSCLENPRDGRAWWAAVYWVTHSRTRPKRFSSRERGWSSELNFLCFIVSSH